MPRPNITRLSNLAIDPSLDNGNPYKIMRFPRINNEEISLIPSDGLKGGEIIFNTDTNSFQSYDGTTWTNFAVTRYFAIFHLSDDSTDYLGDGDHCPFDQVFFKNDPHNLMELSTDAYSTDVGVHSLGRVKLKAGYMYKIEGYVSSSGNTQFYGFSLYDVTTAATVCGTQGGSFSQTDQHANADSMLTTGYIIASEDTLVELRKTGGTLVNWYNGNSNLSECWLNVSVIG